MPRLREMIRSSLLAMSLILTSGVSGQTTPAVLTVNDTTPFSTVPCPSNFHLTAGTTRQQIYSPNYPNRYNNYHNCSWHIEAPANTSLRMSISGYEIESHSSCGYDALQIFNGQNRFGELVTTLCGHGSFTLDNLQVTNAFIWFQTDLSITRDGFQLDYWTGSMDSQENDQEDDNPCDVTALELEATSEERFLLSPGYPNSYSNFMDCSWTITFPEGNYLSIGLYDFDLEGHYRCDYDFLDIYNVDSSNNQQNVAKLCGVKSSGTYSVENEAYLHFSTDYSVVRKGFKLSYKYTSEPPEAQPCDGGLLNLQALDEDHLIMSPNYPSSYPNHANCSWLIQASPDHEVILSIEDFKLENHDDCSYDAVEIFDGPNSGALSLGKLCGSQTSRVYASSSSEMYINFHSDYSVRYRGFKLSYMQVEEFHPACHGQVLALQAYTYTRSFVSPSYSTSYLNDLECEWLITGNSSAEYVLIGIEDLHVQDSPNCTSDAVILYDGNNENSSELANLCGDISPGSQEFLSNSSSVRVRFLTDSSESDIGFNISYRSVDETYIACYRGPLYVRASQYSNASIASPDYPSYYWDTDECVWYVESTLDYVHITMDDIALSSENSSQSNCSGDALEIYDGIDDTAPLLVKTCGGISRPAYISSSKSVFIRFISTESDGSSRFRVTVTGFAEGYQACMGEPHRVVARTYAQSFTSPNYPSSYPNNVLCKWLIVSPTPYVKLSLGPYSMEYHSSCRYDGLLIYEGPNTLSTEVARLCGRRSTERAYILSSSITYVSFYSDALYNSSGFNLTYQALEDYHPACEGQEVRLDATELLKSFESPGYPLAYNNNLFCSWYIVSTEYFGIVSLYVDDIHLGDDCNQDRLVFYDGYGLYETLCSQNSSLAPVYRSYRNWMRVRFYSDESTTHRGFKLSYKREYIPGCHGSTAWLYANATEQYITSPYYPLNYPNYAYCRWTVVSETGALLVNIEDLSMEFDDSCYNDYLRIRESYYGTTLARVCGNESSYLHTNIVSHNRYTSIWFSSNSEDTGRGFRLSYRTAEPEWIACNDGPFHVEASSSWRNLTSPNFPEPYPAESNCSWVVEADSDDFVVIKVHYLKLSESSSCVDSFLGIFQESNVNSTSLAWLCGEPATDSLEYISYTGKVLIWFSSNTSVFNGGFQLSYKQISFEDLACHDSKAELQATTEVQSISMYWYNDDTNSAGCSWKISSQTGYVRAVITYFRITTYYGEDLCSNGHIQVYDGTDETFPGMGKVCRVNSYYEEMFTSTSNDLFFHLNRTTVYRGISLDITFNTVHERFPACIGAPLQLKANSSDQWLEALPYYGNTLCRWDIKSEQSHVFMIIEDAELQCGYPYYSDDMYIYDGPVYSRYYYDYLVNVCHYQRWRSIWSVSNVTSIVFRSGAGTSSRNFRLMYRSTNESFYDACTASSKTLYAETDEEILVSPGYPSSYFKNISCTWYIRSRQYDDPINLHVEDINLGDDCSQNGLELYDGYDIDEILCEENSSLDTVYRSRRNWIRVRFYSDESIAHGGFKISYKTDYYPGCHGSTAPLNANATEQIIESPRYPLDYPNNAFCKWTIYSETGMLLVYIEDFRLEGSSSCYFDYLLISEDNSGRILATVCGSGVPYLQTDILSHGHYTSVTFSTDYSVTYRGFRLRYRTLDPILMACDSGPFQVDAGSYWTNLTSPNYPNAYPTPSNCSWLIEADDEDFVVIKVLDLRLPESSSCADSFLEIFEGTTEDSTSLARLCGELPSDPLEVISQTGKAFIWFISNSSFINGGFQLSYKQSSFADLACYDSQWTFSASYEIRNISFSWYNYLPNSAGCIWRISSQTGYVRAVVTSFSVYTYSWEDYGSNGYLQVYDGANETSPDLGRIYQANSSYEEMFTSSSNHLYFHLHQIRAYRRIRLYITFNTIDERFPACIGAPLQQTATSSAKLIEAPPYLGNTLCRWDIKSEENYVFMTINDVELDCGYPYYRDNMYIYDGPVSTTSYYDYLVDVCSIQPPRSIWSVSNLTRVVFKSGSGPSFRHFKLMYRSANESFKDACSGTSKTLYAESSEQFLVSPGYPSAYFSHISCSWLIRPIEHNGYLNLYVDDIDLGNNCSQDRLEIYEGYSLLDTLCGQNSHAAVYRSSRNWMRARFYSYESATHRGFKLSYKREYFPGCHGSTAWLDANSTQQTIVSPYYPSNYTNNAYCKWTIYSETGALLVYIEDVSLESKCYYDYLYIRESSYGLPLARVCGNGSPFLHTDIFSHNHFTSIWFRSNSRNTNRGFKLRYSSVDPEWIACNVDGPLRVQASSYWKNISSPNYPNAYPVGSNCSWVIEPIYEDYVVISVHFLNLPESSPCADSFLEIYQGANENSTSLAELCGELNSDLELISYTGIVFIRFSSNSSFTNGGFQLSYKQASFVDLACYDSHGTWIASHETQSLSFYWSSYLPNSAGCFWKISSQTGHVRAIVTRFSISTYYGEELCSNGYLQVYDGANETSPDLGTICETNSSYDQMFTSSANVLFFHLNQFAYRRISLSITFNTVDERLPACVGDPLQVQGRSYYQQVDVSLNHGNMLCRWEVMSDQNYTFMTVEDVELNCAHNIDNLRIYDGRVHSRSSYDYLVDVCSLQPPRSIWSVSNMTSIVFKAGAGPGSRHFKLMYRSANESFYYACTRRPHTLYAESYEKILESPGYPSSYFNNMFCSWDIQSSEYYGVVNLYVEDINLGNNCSQDRLEIYDGYYLSETLCAENSSFAHVYRSHRRWMRVRFYSDGSITHRGFKLSYKREYIPGCHGDIARLYANDTQQILESPYYPSNYLNNAYCRYRIYSETEALLLYIEDLSMEYDDNCYHDYLHIREDYYGRTLARVCGNGSQYVHTDILSQNRYTSIWFRSDSSITYRGFRLRYWTAEPEWIACTLDDPLRVEARSYWKNISSPNPNTPSNCSWLIEADHEDYVVIKVHYVRLTESSSCADSFLGIFEGTSENSTSLVRFCGEPTSDSPEFISTTGVAFMRYISDVSLDNGGFHLSYKQASLEDLACYGSHAELQASHEIQRLSLSWYGFRNSCLWKISSQTGYARAIVTSFRIYRYSWEDPCSYGYLQVYDGANETSPGLGTICQANSSYEEMFTSSSKDLFFHFNQIRGYRSVYLRITFNSVDERFPACVGPPLQHQAFSHFQTIEAAPYTGNTFCRWEIMSEQNYVFMTIDDVELECGSPYEDTMRIYDGPAYRRYSYDYLIDVCHLHPPIPFWSVSNLTSIVFKAGGGPSSRHFKLMYRSVPESYHAACSGSSKALNAEPHEQSLVSPGFPSLDFNVSNLNCAWTIYSSPHTAVRINFHDVRFQPDSNCSDYLEIYEGSHYYYDSYPPTRLCGGSSFNQTYVSFSSMVTIHYHSDRQDMSNGFNLTYDSVDESYIACHHQPRHLRADYEEGHIRSPNYPDTYPNNSNCAWAIEVPSGRIFLSVVNFHIDNSTDCSNEALEILDGDNPHAESLDTLCGEKSSHRYVSSSTAMYIQFHSDDTRDTSETGFNLLYRWIPPNHRACFGPPLEISVNSTPGHLFFWGNDYANESVNCGWHLKANEGFIRIFVPWTALSYTSECLYGSFEIFDGANDTSPSLLKECGHDYNDPTTSYKSTSNELFLQLNYYNYAYFDVYYVNVQPNQACQGQPVILHADSDPKTLESPGYSIGYSNNADCSWEIRADNGTIDLYFVDFRLEESVGCVKDSLEIFDGPNENAKSLDRLCTSYAMYPGYHLSSSSSTLFLRFQTDNSVTLSGFFLVYGESGVSVPFDFYY